MSKIEIFNYEGTDITFQNSKDIMMNATSMIKSFPGKKMNYFLKKCIDKDAVYV